MKQININLFYHKIAFANLPCFRHIFILGTKCLKGYKTQKHDKEYIFFSFPALVLFLITLILCNFNICDNTRFYNYCSIFKF